LHNKNNFTLIKANLIKTANFLEDLIGGIFNSWIRKDWRKNKCNKINSLSVSRRSCWI